MPASFFIWVFISRASQASMKIFFILQCLFIAMLSGLPAYAQDDLFQATDYANGLQAYLDEDYQTARTYWLNSAKANDAKSMFNLGLLHEKGLISGADEQKADKWFQLAGKHGYGPADYHLAQKLLAKGEQTKAQALLDRAANSGFLLAAQQLGKTNNKTPFKSSDITNSKNADRTNVKHNTELNFLGETWILQRRSSAWTIQMLAFKELDKVHRFIQENQLNNKAAYFVERAEGVVYYKLIYGEYENKEQANQAREKLAPKLKEFGPWLRSMSSVQAVIAKR